MDQLNIFDFLDEIKDEKIYYYDVPTLHNLTVSGFKYRFTYRNKDLERTTYQGISLLDTNGKQVYKDGFVFEFNTEKAAKAFINQTVRKWNQFASDMKKNSDRYPIVILDSNLEIENNVFLVPSIEKDYEKKTVFAPCWYSNLYGYLYSHTFRLPYDDEMDIKGKILWQTDCMERLEDSIIRDKKRNTIQNYFYYADIDELLLRNTYLHENLNYHDFEIKLDINELKEELNQYHFQRKDPISEFEPDPNINEEIEDDNYEYEDDDYEM